MADFLFNFISSSAQTLNGSESGLIGKAGGLYIDGADAVNATSGTNWLTNDGIIYAYDGGFAAVDADGTVFELLNGPQGIITAENPSDGTLDFDLSTLGDVTNHGTIHSSNDHAINFQHSDGHANFFLDNFGAITSNNGEAIRADLGIGYTYLVNHGAISGGNNVITINGDNGSTTTQTITNHGTITSQDGFGLRINVGAAGEVNLLNTGTISAWSEAISTTRDTEFRITNTGIIASLNPLTSEAIDLGDSRDVVMNSGEIGGSVLLNGGNDTFQNLANGVASDAIYGGDGSDTLIGGGHTDLLDGGGDDDRMFGMDGDDMIRGDLGNDTIFGGAGADSLSGGSNDDVIHGGSGGDAIDGGSGADDLRGDSGDDTIFGGSAEDTIDGGSGDDNIDGGSNADMIFGRSGDDFIRGGTGLDVIEGGSGDDTIAGNSGHDEIDGGSGDDRIFGGANNDTLRGTLGNDFLDGGSGEDLLYGGSDNDTLIGGTGQDMLYGGWGADVFVWRDAGESPWDARDTIADFAPGEDKIDISAIHPSLAWTPGGFTGVAGQVYYSDATGTLWVDMNGSGNANFGIDLDGNPALDAGDVIL